MGKRRSDKIYGIPIAVIVVGVLWYFSGSTKKSGSEGKVPQMGGTATDFYGKKK